MTFIEYKKELIKSSEAMLAGVKREIEELKGDIIKLDQGHTQVLEIGKKYNTTGKDLKSLKESLEKCISVLEVNKKHYKDIIRSAEADFKEKFSDIAFILYGILISGSYEDLIYINTIFKRLISLKTEIEPDSEYSSKCASYESRLRELLDKDREEFNRVALEYFRFALNAPSVKGFLERLEIDVNLDYVKHMLEIDLFKKVRLPRDMVKSLKNSLKNEHLKLKKMLEDLTMAFNDLVKLNFNDARVQKNILANLGFSTDNSGEDFLLYIKSLIDLLIVNCQKLVSMGNALGDDGFKRPVPGLPLFTMMFDSSENDFYLQYLILTGIKCNGSFKKKTKDDSEKDFYDIELQMARLIQRDYTVNAQDQEKFMELYEKYLYLHINFANDMFKKIGKSAYEDASTVLNSMRNYLTRGKEWQINVNASSVVNNSNRSTPKKDLEIKPEVVTPKTVVYVGQSKKPNLLEPYIIDGRVVQACPLDMFANILNSADLPIERKEEYYRQMVNFIKRVEQEEAIRQQNLIWEEYFSLDDLALYNEARMIDSAEVGSIVADINFVLELFLVTPLDEREELVDTVNNYLDILRDKLKSEYDELPNVVFYKDKDLVPYFYRTVSGTQKGKYKTIYKMFNKILEGSFGGDRELTGLNLPVKVMCKGKDKDFKIFYVKQDDMVLIIDGGEGDNAVREVKELVSTPGFLKLLQDILGGFKRDNQEYMQMVEELLLKSRPSERK